MTVRAKFKCMGISHAYSSSPGYAAATVSMVPVWEEKGVNREWSKATPSGKLEMLITNPEAVEQFELGKNYELTFNQVD